MKLKSSLLTLVSLLLLGSVASAAPASTPADPASASFAAIFSAPVPSDCADAELPSFEPAPTDKAGVLCGSCSDSLCSGKQSGSFCKSLNGRTYTCQHAYYKCSVNDCQCWTGPLP